MSYGDYENGEHRGSYQDRLADYKTVAERIIEAKAAFPHGRFQTEILRLPPGLAEKFVAVKARFFRSHDDMTPGEGVAWEPVPGRTPYTKDSELQNAETSAWGRALVAALVVDASKGIASRDEVRNRRPSRKSSKAAEKPKAEPLTPEQIEAKAWVKQQKEVLLAALGGDKDKARLFWGQTLEKFSLAPDAIPEPDMRARFLVELDYLLQMAVDAEASG